MQTLGERLEEARKRKGISIREAAEATKIRGDYLQKFESNSFDIDLPPLYVRGFVRAYARFLEFDAQRFLAEYDTLSASEGRSPRRETREVYGRVDFNEGGEPGGPTGNQKQAIALKYGLFAGGAVLLLVVVLVLVNVLFTGAPKEKPATQSTQTAPATPPASAPAAQSLEAIFTVTAVEATRVKVATEDNGTVYLDGAYPMPKGQSKVIRYTQDLIVTVENPANIRIELNGRSAAVPTQKQMGQFRVPYAPPR